ncbi:MAG: pilus assembly protein, partial [Aeromicrobium sp.]
MLQSRRDRGRAGGQIIVLFTFVLVVILAIAAIVIDVGLLRNNRQTLVNAMDAGALAGGTLLPVDGANPADVAEIEALIEQTVQATYAGLSNPEDYQITYRCLIGVAGSPRQAAISRDIPLVCDPSHALGHPPVSSDFIGAGPTRSSICDPGRGDRCNAVEVAGAVTTNYSFGQAVGVDSGSTGVVRAAACNGPCGEPPLTPVDLVLVIDRSNSMSGDENNLRDAANAVLQAYDPGFQHVALGVLGPSTLDSDCPGSPSGVHAIPLVRQTTSSPDYESDASDATPAAGAGSLSISKPSGTSVGDVLVAGITVDGGNAASVTPPSGAGGWTEILRTNNDGDIGLASYYKVVTAADEGIGSYSFEISPDGRAGGGIIRFSGVDTDDPIDGSSGNTNEGVGATAQGFTTSADDTALVGFFATDTGTTFGDADSMTERFDLRSGDDGGDGPTISGNTDTQGGNGGT